MARIEFGFDVSVSQDKDKNSTTVSLCQDDYEANCGFLSLKHLEGSVDALIKVTTYLTHTMRVTLAGDA